MINAELNRPLIDPLKESYRHFGVLGNKKLLNLPPTKPNIKLRLFFYVTHVFISSTADKGTNSENREGKIADLL